MKSLCQSFLVGLNDNRTELRNLAQNLLAFLVGTMLGGNPNLPLGITLWVYDSHHFFFLLSLISFGHHFLPHLTVDLHEFLDAKFVLNFLPNFLPHDYHFI
ncbi:hypothetical protein ACFE04_012551 [Oxalis oulophora]